MDKAPGKLRAAIVVGWRLLKNPRALTLSLKDLRFLSDRETLMYLKENKVGIVRFGDGDLNYIAGRPNNIFQKYNKKLQKRLIEILSGYKQDGNFLIAPPLDLILGNEYEKRGALPVRWRTAKYTALPFLKRSHVYGSAVCFRLWNTADDDKEGYVQLAKSLFQGKDVIYIGNEESIKDIRNIVVPVESISIPSKDAFELYEELLEKTIAAAEKVAHPLVLISASVTATVLSADLNDRGILAYDVGFICQPSYKRIIHNPPQSFASGLNGKTLALFFTKGVSFQEWDRLGMLDREILPYQTLADKFKRLFFFTYGGKADLKYASLFPSNVEIVPKRFPLPAKLYSILVPFLYWKKLAKADIIKTNQMNGSWSAVIAKYLCRSRLVVRCGYEWLNVMEKRNMALLKLALAALLERFAYRSADAIIVTSEEIKKFVVDRFNIPTAKITVIPNSIDTERFRPLDVAKDERRLIFVGKLEDQKNLFSLIEALSGLSLHLVVIGSGVHRDALEKLAENKGVSVEFKGNMPQSRLPEELNKSALFVLPSHYEGNPKALLEAMACALPCIGTDVEGINTVLKHKQNGYLCRTDAEAIRRAIQEVLADKQMQRRMGAAARETIVSRFEFHNILQQELAIYQKLVL